MDGFSGAAAVLSLTIQLASTVHSIRQFLRNVENAPKELASVIEQLDLLHQILSYLEDFMQRQATLEHPPISDALVTSALQSCEKRVRSVEDQVKPFTARLFRRHWLQKALGSMKFVLKKEDIQTSQVLVGGAIQMLQLALFTNQVHYAHVTITGVERLLMLQSQTADDFIEEEARVPPKSIDNVPYPACQDTLSISAKSESSSFYRGVFGSVNLQRRRKFVRSLAESCPGDGKPASDSLFVTIQPSFMQYSFDMSFAVGTRFIPRTLNVYHTLSDQEPIFDYVCDGSLSALQLALQNGIASPFVTDESGYTLLHWAARYCRANMCEFLVQIGVDANREDMWGQTAIQSAGRANCDESWKRGTNAAVDTIRLLARYQDYLPTTIAHWYSGPPEGAELMLSLDLFEVNGSQERASEYVYPLLTIALDKYAGNPIWESFIRRLLNSKIDLHANSSPGGLHKPVCEGYPSHLPCWVSLGTPLDQLLGNTETPYEGYMKAQWWLRILESEGYDVRTYLEEEKALHAMHSYSILGAFKNFRGPHRRMRFELEKEPPELHWDWWTDPNSSASLILEEFKWMNGANEEYACEDFSWPTFWPFDVLNKWDHFRHDDNERSAAIKRKRLCAQRWKRKQRKKEGKANGCRDTCRMPGSWPG